MWCHVLLPVLPSPRPRCCCCLFLRRQLFFLFNTVVLLPSACLLLSFSSFIVKISSTIHCTLLNTFPTHFYSVFFDIFPQSDIPKNVYSRVLAKDTIKSSAFGYLPRGLAIPFLNLSIQIFQSGTQRGYRRVLAV